MAVLPGWLCLAVFTLTLTIEGADAGNYCYVNNPSSYTYCDYGCCGSSGSRYCCEWSPTAGLIVGCIFAALFVISVIVVVVCCCIKKKAHSGKVISPATGSLASRPGAGTITTATVTPGTVTTTTMHLPPGTGVYHPPPSGNNPHHLPPLIQAPAYQPSAPPPPYALYGTTGMQQQQQQQQQQMSGYGYGFGGVAPPPTSQGAPTTAYGKNFVV